jgi:ribonuclease P/MRP protein subunit RPP1
VVFELCYAPALREPTVRRQLFANALAVVRAAGGAGVILSSGALRAFELRGPYDVANLGTLFGLSLAAAKEAVASRTLAVLQHAHARRSPSVGRHVVLLAAQHERRPAKGDGAWPAPPTQPLPAPAALPARDAVMRSDQDAASGFLAL